MFSLPLEKADLNAMPQCIARSMGTQEHGTITKQVKRYIWGSKPCSRVLQLENKQQTMQNNVETQHKHMYLLYIGSFAI